jgi:uncharacterized membrane protein HdeD (DUF308 family)
MRRADVGSGKLAASTRLDSVGRGTTMTADVSSSYSGAPTTGHSGLARTGLALFGGAAVIVGGILLFNPYAAVRTLALLLGLSLVIGGCLEIALGWESGRRAAAILLGAVLIVGGLLAAFWPEATVWTLAVLTGVSLLVHGLARVAVAFAARAQVPRWGWLALAGAVNVAVGILVLAWPEVTVLILSVMLGVQVLAFGVLVLFAAFSGSRSHAQPSPAA